ncbi:MAG: hypothetical protein K8S94_04765 [Planctomycetia bacterium]|nr:hypothetical protein [Planctomycetia bacterium]
MTARGQNERKFGSWRTLAHGGRLYFMVVSGKLGWTARYLKEVDAAEQTLRFWQEIYDSKNRLVEVHEKFPQDFGHRRVEESPP